MNKHLSARRGTLSACSLALLVAPELSAVTRSWSGLPANNAPWSNASLWGGSPPTAADDAWFNTANNFGRIDSTVTALGNQIVLGRTATGVRLAMTGGSLSSTGELLVGQYAGADGRLDLSGGTLTVGTNFSVGAAGSGVLAMSGGAVNVGGTFHLNRYAGTALSGAADISGGTVAANTLFIGAAGELALDNTTLTLNGDKRSLVNGYASTGALYSYWGALAPINPTYNATTNKTTVAVANGRNVGISAFGSTVLGPRPITYDYTGVPRLSPAPAAGVHPRIYFNAEDLPAIRARLTGTLVGQEAVKMIRIYTSILRNGRSIGYDQLPVTTRTMPDNTARIGNVGLYDQSAVYAQLVSGTTSGLSALTSTSALVLSSGMALEGFECLVDEGGAGVAQRLTNLAAALDTWAVWAVAQPTYAATPWMFGGHQTSLAYDMAFNAMTTGQRANVRKAIAVMMTSFFNTSAGPGGYVGAGSEPEAVATNWVALDSFRLLAGYAIEGEVTTADAGFSAADLTTWMTGAMAGVQKYFTYGWYNTGASVEGMGKCYTFAAHLFPAARRGYDFFGHQNLRAHASQFIQAMIQPFGYTFTSYDVLGGTGADPEKGKNYLNASDFVGAKWMYPQDTAVDFTWRNYVRTPYRNANGDLVTFIDTRDGKFPIRSYYQNTLLPAAIYAADVASTADWTTHHTEARGSLDFLDDKGGTFVSRSSYEPDATSLLVHIRQDFGGHTNADRNAFSLSSLGRIFVNLNVGGSDAGLQWSEYQSVIHIDGLAMKVTTKEGNKCRIPGKITASSLTPSAAFISGDATYAYTNEWTWNEYSVGGTIPLTSGFTAETNVLNSFRRTGNTEPYPFFTTAFAVLPHWVHPGKLEGIQRKSYNPMRQVYRTAGLVRGAKPYALVLDDVRKDDTTHTYKWYASVASDLTLLTDTALPVGADPATDVVLQEPSATGDRRLLVRILRADGTPVQASGTIGSSLAYLQTVTTAHGSWKRLVIERSAVVEPGYRVLLFPFRSGEALPTTSVSGSTITVSIGTQTDTLAFFPRTASVAGQSVTMNEFTLSRSGSTLVDYRNQVEPIAVR